MSWSRGSSLAATLWGLVREHIPEPDRECIANRWIGEFNRLDADMSSHECPTLFQDAGVPELDD